MLVDMDVKSQELISQGVHFSVYRAEVPQLGGWVIIKKPCLNDWVTNISRLKHEYDIRKRLGIEGIPRVLRYIETDENHLLVSEDAGQHTIRDKLQQGAFTDIACFLSVSIQIVTILENLHACKIIHKNLNPDNILLQNDRVNIIGFSLSSTGENATFDIIHPLVLEHILPYFSPEQTGRMNRELDYRSDFYSLGVCFFEMLTGRTPFESNDPIELIHKHLARMPEFPEECLSNLPPVICNIILKLLEKNPEKRYQSCFGLLNDLKYCFQQITNEGAISFFSVGVSDRLAMIKKTNTVFGRKVLLKQLLEDFRKVAAGDQGLVLLKGFSGVGKTALVNEFYRRVSSKPVFTAFGRCDTLKRKTPFFAVVQMFSQLISQILTLSEDELKTWKLNIENILGVNAGVVAYFFPELMRIIDVDPIQHDINSFENDKLVTHAMLDLLSLFASHQTPCLLVFDDLQWVDSGSAHLIHSLLKRIDFKFCMVIGICREEKINYQNIFIHDLSILYNRDRIFRNINLEPLDEAATALMISSMLSVPQDQLQDFASVVYGKTSGNPFYIQQFIQTLYDKSYIHLNEEKSHWVWNLEVIADLDMVGDVESIIRTKLQELSADVIEVMTVAACVGYSFTLDDIVIASRCDREYISMRVIKLVNSGLVQACVKTVVQSKKHDIKAKFTEYRFLHERVQQIAYQLIGFKQRYELHLSIARAYLKLLSNKSSDENIYFIVDQFNIGLPILEDEIEKYVVSRLNIVAGQRSKASGAYDLALNYFKRAVGLINQDHWITHYKFMLSLYVESIEVAYYSRSLDFVESLEKQFYLYTDFFIDQVPVIVCRIHFMCSTNNIKAAMDSGVDTLKKMGLDLGRPASEKKLQREYDLIQKRILDLGGLSGIRNLQKCYDPLQNALINILATQIEPGLILNKTYFRMIVQAAVKEVLTSYHPCSGFIFAYFALLTAHVHKNVDQAIEFGEMALTLQRKHKEQRYLPRVLNAVNAHIRHYWQPIYKTLPGFERSIDLAVKAGDINYAGQAIVFFLLAQFASGERLTKLEEFIHHQVSLLSIHHLVAWRDAIFPWCQVIQNMQNVNEAYLSSNYLTKLKGRFFNDALLFQVEKTENEFVIFSAYTAKAWNSFFYKDIDAALAAIQKAEGYCCSMNGMLHFYIFNFLAGQIFCAAARRYEHEADLYLSKALGYLGLIEELTAKSPENYLNKLYLLKAEIAYCQDDHLQAMKYYEKSIRQSIQSEFTHEAAMAAEQAGLYCLENNLSGAARGYLMTAMEHYKQWGAAVKVFVLSRDYAGLLMPYDYSVLQPVLPVTDDHQHIPFLRQQYSIAKLSNDDPIDYLSALRISHLISQELDPQKLLSIIIELISINAGADRGILLLTSGDELATAASFPKVQLQNTKDNTSGIHGCMNIINYVKRLRKPIVIDDAMSDAQYFGDQYIYRHQVRSILCAPFMYQTRLLGVIYLENNQASHVFNTERLAFLQLVAKQSAISLENSRFYETILSAEEALQEQKGLLESILNSISEGVLVIDDQKKLIHYNHMAKSLLGIDSIHLQPDRWPKHYGLYTMDKKTYFPADVFPTIRALNGETFNDVEMHIRNEQHQDGRDILVSGCPLTSVDGKLRRGGVISLRDMSEFNRNLEQIQHLATHDELTALPNRNLFYDRIAQAVRLAAQNEHIGAVVFLDLDNFKEVNDSLGHSIGDLLLQEISERLQHLVKDFDTVARLGGDEFGMLLDKLDSFDDASKIAQRMIESIAKPILVENQLIQTSVSVGLTIFPIDGTDTEQLLKNADLAMYSAKGQGRNTYCFYATHMNEKIMLKKELGHQLRQALDLSQFVMHYQPQINPVTQKLVGLEALIRWPDHCDHSVEQFIGVAEEIGIIHLIGEWVLRHVCLQLKQWSGTILDVPVAINISALQFRQSKFIDMVKRVLRETGVSPAKLEFELTESSVFHFKDGLAKMQQLNAIGINISLDDFGTGYSSLSHLKRLPVSKVKIDKSFILDLEDNNDSTNIAHAIITLGHCLNLAVVAEGVESKEQLDILTAKNCDIIQGHYYSKPLPVDQIDHWVNLFMYQ